jgi:hypothetical protein
MSDLQRTSAASPPPDECDWHRCEYEPKWQLKWYEKYGELDRSVPPRDYAYYCSAHEAAIETRASKDEIDDPQHVKKI